MLPDYKLEAASWSQANATARREWVEAHLHLARRMHADGTNFDFEEAVPYDSNQQAALYATLIAETADAARAALPGFQVSVDVAWSPAGIDGCGSHQTAALSLALRQ